jgi:hypothetical protein
VSAIRLSLAHAFTLRLRPAKKRPWLEAHLSTWVCYRNHVRGRTNRAPHVMPAMTLGVEEEP